MTRRSAIDDELVSAVKWIINVVARLRINLDYLLLFLAATLYTILLSYYAVFHHQVFGSNAWDLGIYNQAMYSALKHWKLFYHTVDLPGNPTGSFFGVHFSPIMFLLLPIYALHPDPATLLILRPIIVSIGAIPLYWIARDELKSKFLIALFIIAYFAYPPVFKASFNFDLEVFLPTFFLFSIYYLKKNSLPRAYAFLVLALMVNEFVPFIVIAAGIYYFLSRNHHIITEIRQRKIPKGLIFSLAVILTGVLWWILATFVISHFNPTALSTKWEWGEFGQGPREIITNVLINPSKSINVLMSNGHQKIIYISSLFGPLAFLSFLDPLVLLMAGPWLAASLLSIDPLYYTIGFQYAGFVSAFLFVSAINGAKRFTRLSEWIIKRFHHFTTVPNILLIALILTVILFPVQTYTVTGSPDIIRQSITMVPADASISAMPEFFPHFSNRLDAYPYYTKGVDYVLLDIYSWWYDVTFPRPTHTAQKWSEVEIGSEYGIALNAQGILLYKRGYTGEPFFIPTNLTLRCDDLAIGIGKVVLDETSVNKRVLAHNRNESDGVFWFDSPHLLPPGTYNVTVRLKVSSRTVFSPVLLLDVTANSTLKLAEKEVHGNNFSNSRQWQSFTMSFILKRTTSVQIMGTRVTNATDVYLDFIQILQTSGRR